MLAVRIPADIESRLDDLAKKTGRTKTYYVREALVEYLADLEDHYLAEERLTTNRAAIPLDEVERTLGLESGLLSGGFMQSINLHEAKTHFSKLVDAAMHGEEIIIAKAGKPAARLVPISDGRRGISFGLMKGEITIAGDFDAPLPEALQNGFEGDL